MKIRFSCPSGLTAAVWAAPVGSEASAPAACNIVSFAEAGKALDAAVAEVKTHPRGDAITCVFRASTGYKRLDVSILPFANAAEAKSEYHAMVTDPRTYVAPSQDLSGIGDQAHRFGPMILRP